MIAIVILTIDIDRKIEKFLNSLKNKYRNYDIFICCDIENKNIKPKYKNIKIIQKSHTETTKKGYKDFLLRYYHRKDTKQKSFAPDKAFYYFCNEETKKYDYYWFLEDDVLIPHIDTIKILDDKYKNNDLLVENYKINPGDDFSWHWPQMLKNNRNRDRKIRIKRAQESNNYYFQPPWYGSWASIFRCSNKFIDEVKKFVKKHKTLYFGEIFLVNLAIHNNLKVESCKNFKIRYKYEDNDNLWKKEEIEKDSLFTPIKKNKSNYII